MRFDRETNTVYLPVTELAAYAFQRENAARLTEYYGFRKYVTNNTGVLTETSDTDSKKYQPDDTDESLMNPSQSGLIQHHVYQTDTVQMLEAAQTEVPLEKVIGCGKYSVCVQGYADLITYDGVLYTIEELKTVSYFKAGLTPFDNPEHFAQAVIYAYLFSNSAGLSEIKIRISFLKRSNGDKISFVAKFTQVALSRMFDSLLDRAHTFLEICAERYTVFPKEVENMPFPYRSIRDGQTVFIKTAYRCIRRGESLMVSAPTGIGKTMSSLFPAVKALGDSCIDRVFYLTAKTITGYEALNALQRISKYAQHIRAVIICAKEQLCPFRCRKDAVLPPSCRLCENRNTVSNDFGKTSISYRERQLAALTQLLLDEDKIYTTERIKKTAADHRVCPYELSLDLSESCPVIVCDYNYVIDDNVRFQRYFKNAANTEKYAFLFDEAHNLPDRTRNTYSARLTMDTAVRLSELLQKELSDEKELTALAEEYYRAMTNFRSLCTESQYVRQLKHGEEVTCGYYESDHMPDELIRCANNLARLLGKYVREGHDYADVFEPFYRELQKAAFCASFFDEKFRFFGSRIGSDCIAQILCLDPAGILERMLSRADSTILFSATLSPMDYFAQVTGMSGVEILELDSPYERDNLCIVAYDSISTRLNDRKSTAYDCAEIIAETVTAREGNYLVYFPSYDYMTKVCRAFASLGLDCAMIMQKTGMSYRERERFIEIFRERKHHSVVGFCVLGGMFSEGIDLAGESLIGAVIVGTGMPMLSAERNIMAAYYDEKTERGHEFAYTCPGMNKVLQAAGRVIRSESDRGVIVLIDDRLGDPNLKKLFPPHWRHMKYTGNPESLRAVLDEFWNED